MKFHYQRRWIYGARETHTIKGETMRTKINRITSKTAIIEASIPRIDGVELVCKRGNENLLK